MSAPDQRAAYIAGLRKLADLLEQHDAIPLPTTGHLSPVYIPLLGADPARLDAVKALIGGEFACLVHGGHVYHETRAPGVLISLMTGTPEVTP